MGIDFENQSPKNVMNIVYPVPILFSQIFFTCCLLGGIAFSIEIQGSEEFEVFCSSISPSSWALADFFVYNDPYNVGNFSENQAANTATEPEEGHTRLGLNLCYTSR
jgi:hypothetical protein